MKVSRSTMTIAALLCPCLILSAQQPTTAPLQNPDFSSVPVSPSVRETAALDPMAAPHAATATAPIQNSDSSSAKVPAAAGSGQVASPRTVSATTPTQSPAPSQVSPSATVGAQATAGQPAPTPVVPTTYVVGPEDSIQVTVWHEPTFSGAFPVRPDGMISLALVGDVMAAGRTPMDLANELTNRLKAFVTDPTVTVTVMAVNSKHVYMLGEVAHIGPLPLTTTLSPLQAISAAGGLTPYANKSKIYILRVDASGKKIKIPFNYKKAIKDGDLQGVVLLPGDTIVVP